MPGGAEDIEERILSLHTEMCERSEVTSVEEGHDSGNVTSRWQRPRSKQHYEMRLLRTNSRKFGEKTSKHQAEVNAEFHVEKEKAAEMKNQVQRSNIEQPLR